MDLLFLLIIKVLLVLLPSPYPLSTHSLSHIARYPHTPMKLDPFGHPPIPHQYIITNIYSLNTLAELSYQGTFCSIICKARTFHSLLQSSIFVFTMSLPIMSLKAKSLHK